MHFRYPKYQRGQFLLLVAVSLVTLVGFAGLAIDSGRGYGVKAKLNAAVDAAGIAGARALSQGSTQADQTTKATEAAIKFFNANYPDGYLGSTATLNPPQVTFPPQCTGGTCVTISANAVLPVSFMSVLGADPLTVSASAQAVRQDVDLAFVVDITGSMSDVAASVRNRAQQFLDHLNQLRDRVALISYKPGAQVNDAIRTTTRGFARDTMKSHIQNLNFSGNTNSAEGFWQARNQLNSVPTTPLGNRSNLRVIVFFTDGAPNTFASTFPVRRMSTPDPVSCIASGDTAHICNCSGSSTNAGTCTVGGAVCSCSCTGSLVTGDGSVSTPSGLYLHESTNGNLVSGTCGMGNQIISSGMSDPGIYQLPAWYNAPHGGVIPPNEFQIAPAPSAPPGLRTIASAPTYAAFDENINRASRNLVEEMAWQARNEGIYVFVLGLGDLLHGAAGPDNEIGERLLKCMANTNEGGDPSITPLSRCYDDNQTNNRNQPTGPQTIGSYCWARDDAGLKACYDKLASQILRLSM